MNGKDRVRKLRNYMAEKHIDVALLMKPPNQYYITHFKALLYSRPILSFVTMDKIFIIVPGLEEIHARENADVDEIHVYYEHPEKASTYNSPWGLTEYLLKKVKKAELTIGIEAGFVPVAVANLLKGLGAQVVDLDPKIIEMRMIKDQGEIDLIKKAGELVSLAVKETLVNLRKGITEIEVEAIGNSTVLKEAARRYPSAEIELMGMTPSGVARTVLPHVFSNVRAFEEKEIIIHSRQLSLNGYRAECERTCFIGQPSDKQKDVFKVMFEAQQAAIETIQEGVLCKQVDEAARNIIGKSGLGEYFIHRTGHGIGLEPHEAPYLRYDEELILKEGMVITVEPGIYIPGVGGLRHSDTVIVKPKGGEIVTSSPSKLEEVIF